MPIYEITSPDGDTFEITAPEGASEADVMSYAQANYLSAEVAPEDRGNEFTRGIKRGASTSAALVTEGIPAVAKGLTGDALEKLGFEPDFDSRKNLEEYQRKVSEAYEKYPTKVPSFRDIEGFGEAGAFVAATAGEQIPQLVTSLLGGGVGGFAVKRGVQELAKRGGKELTKKELNKAMKQGLLAGTLTTSGAQTIPESYFNLLEKGEDRAATAVALGSFKAGLDVVAPMKILEKLGLGKDASGIVADNLFKRAGIEGGKAAAFEGVTETAQEGIDIIAEQFILENQEMFSPENVDRLVNAGLKGSIGGGLMGAGASPLMGDMGAAFDYDKLSPEGKAKLDAKFEEESRVKQPKTKVNDLDDTIMSPTYLTPEQEQQAASMGIQGESLTTLSPEDADLTARTVEKANMPTTTDINTVYQTPAMEEVMQDNKLVSSLQVRQTEIKEDKRKDNDFLPGDGVVVTGAQTNPKAILHNAQAGLKINDTVALETATAPTVDQPSYSEHVLPKKLGKPTPRWKQSALEFENDLDIVAYIAAKKGKPTEKQQQRMDWAAKATGLKPTEIVKRGQKIREQIKRDAKGQEVIKVSTPDTAFKRVNLPFHGNFRDDFVVPKVVHNNLKGIELTPEARGSLDKIIKQTQRIVNEVAGHDVKILPFESLTDMQDNPVGGAQFLNMVAVAYNEYTLGNIDETTYHEVYHALENMGLLTDQELAVLDANTSALLDYFNKDDYLSGQDFQVYLSSSEGRAELRANAFGKWVADKKNVDNKGIPKAILNFFKKIQNILNKMANAFKGLGYNSMEDIFEGIYTGGKASEVLDNINYTNAIARHQRIGEQFQEAHQEELHSDERFEELMDEQIGKSNKKYDRHKWHKNMTWYGRYLRSMKDSAHRFPALSPIFDAVDRRNKNSAVFMSNYLGKLGNFTKLDKGMRHRLHEIAARNRENGVKAELNAEGKLTWLENGERVTLADPELGKQYMQMMAGYKEVLNDRLTQMQDIAYREFGEDVLNSPNFDMEDVRAAIALADDSTRLEGLLEAFIDYERMSKVDYVPAMRFGDWGITVRNKETGEQVALYTAEFGEFQTGHDKYQMELNLKKIKEEGYDNTEKFEIIGDKGVIKDLSMENLVPFALTKNIQAGKIDPRYLNIELLGSILNSKNLDEEAYADIKNKLHTDIVNRGFNNHFKESKFLGGYSTDWNRVQHAYLSSAAHHLAGVPFQKELAVIEGKMASISDPKIRARAKSFIDYNTSPSEDMMSLRTFNFLWTMGGNVSTAALQMFTLPTTTLGGMTQFNPNALSNMKRISKWFAIGVQMAPNGMFSMEGGIAHLDFGNRERWQPLIDKGTVTQAQVDVFVTLDQEQKLRAALTEESLGSQPFETRSLTGKVKANLKASANMLGLPITVMEQLTRFASTAAMYDLLMTDPKALKRAKTMYNKDPLFQSKMKMSPEKGFLHHAAEFAMDEAHAVFGKLGRPEYMRSYGGALFFPFMTYPQMAIEFILRMMGRGKDGRRGAYTTLTALFLLSGLTGLPGGELLKELLEALEKEITGSEEDFEELVREKVYEMTGDVKFAKFVTRGLGRAYGDVAISGRVGLPIPGQNIAMNVLGIRGDTTDLFGVSGSFMSAIGDAWSEYNNGGGGVKVMSAMMPVAPANMLKAITYANEGVKTQKGVQLVTPEDITKQTIVARFLGVTSDQVATQRELLYLNQLAENRHVVAIERFRTKAKGVVTKMRRAQKRQDFDKAKALNEDYRKIRNDYVAYARKEGFVPDVESFVRSVNDAVKQRLDPTMRPMDVRKIARKSLKKRQEVYGVPQ